ncbi:hypothetical protein F383_29390 [Gossypium arboreum]|uniref:Uncharacterized protein n=1 Tax=Gossypium arboreum TaxID=29729 RepID=A0A0B0MQN9_GOSAR|nr:hypothetical protein F383_29390 [Gossypium arboreum]
MWNIHMEHQDLTTME